MLMKENEAQEKGCPLLRMAPMGKFCGCIGSQCAMWRWYSAASPRRVKCENQAAETEAEAGTRPEGPWEFAPCDEFDAQWVETEESANARRLGYCGLAGRPPRI